MSSIPSKDHRQELTFILTTNEVMSTDAPTWEDANFTPSIRDHFQHKRYIDSDYYPHEGNSTLFSASVTIDVTPEHDYLMSWVILWALFVAAIAFGAYQTSQEFQWLSSTRKTAATVDVDLEQKQPQRRHPQQVGGVPVDSSAFANNQSGGGGVGRIFLVGGTRVSMVGTATGSSSGGGSNTGNAGDVEAVSSGDLSRIMFRRLLLLAMVARAIAIPVQIYSDPLWVQLIADTLPVMAFASAWTMLVSFFVQLVGVALGTGTSTTPSIVIQITVYCLYSVLIFTFFFHHAEAAVLLYSLLCCIYAALLGTCLYFCPRLFLLVYPSLMEWGRRRTPSTSSHSQKQQQSPTRQQETSSIRSSTSTRSQKASHQPSSTQPAPNPPPASAIKLAICSGICIGVFAARTINFAYKIVSPTYTASWWWQYGVLELFPGVLFLMIVQHPQASSTPTQRRNKAATSTDDAANTGSDRSTGRRQGGGQRSRNDSHGSGSRLSRMTMTETTPLVRPSAGYSSNSGVATSGSASSLKDQYGARQQQRLR